MLTGSFFFKQLHWNMIRLEGAEVLCNSLRTNRVLTNLDLSYNALGNAAGVLGAALIENNVSSCMGVFDFVFEKIEWSSLWDEKKSGEFKLTFNTEVLD